MKNLTVKFTCAYMVLIFLFALFGTASDVTIKSINERSPLVADAGGPYVGIVGEDIQFEGNATGGVPPYGWFWDFGDGNTSAQQNPVYHYASIGEYNVSLTVTDSNQTESVNYTIATITEEEIPLEIIIAGGFGINVFITNPEDVNIEDLPWEISVVGGLLGYINTTINGTVTITGDGSAQLSTDPLFGLGPIAVNVTIGNQLREVFGIQLLVLSLIQSR